MVCEFEEHTFHNLNHEQENNSVVNSADTLINFEHLGQFWSFAQCIPAIGIGKTLSFADEHAYIRLLAFTDKLKI